MKRLFALLVLLFAAISLSAQAPPVDLEAELNALLNTPLTVASSKATSLRESPGVISVISGEEIAAVAPRNIDDVLRLVPGFQFGYDSQGSSGLMARSFWVYEGKVLILWNNLDISELLYGTTQLGDRFPVDQIKRIEIIRGPGSAIYGGSAELVVIKIVSKDADDVLGTVAGSAGYRYAKGFNDKEAGAMFADVFGGYKTTVGAEAISSSLGTGNTFVYANVTDDRLTVNFLGENMHKDTPVNELLYTNVIETQWVSQNALVKYKFGGPGLSVTPFVTYTKSIPWIDEAPGQYIRREDARFKSGFDGLASGGPWALGFGFANFTDHAAVSPQTTVSIPLNYVTGSTTVEQTDSSGYLEGSYTGAVNVVFGGRYDHNTVSGDKFVPRVALTKAWETFYVKVLFAEAFRTPDILNFGRPAILTEPILPETTRTYEVEVGQQWGANLLTANVYWSRLSNPLVWGLGPNSTGGYINGPDVTGTGLELSYKYKASWGFLNLGYAHAATDNNVNLWSVPSDVHTGVDAAKDQLTALVSCRFSPVVTGSANATYLSGRFYYDALGNVDYVKADVLLNANLTFNLKPWSIIVGGADLLNKKAGIFPGYNSGVNGLPGQGAEAFVKLKYNFK